MLPKCLFLLLVLLINGNNCARILGVFPVPSISHQCVFQPIWRELSLRGHEVTVVTPNPLKDPNLINLTEIDMSYTYEAMKKHGFQYFMSKENSLITKIPRIFALTTELAELIFQNVDFKRIYQDKSQKFDLLLIQTYINPILFSLSAKFGAPAIGISSLDGWVGTHYSVGNPVPPALYSDIFTSNQGKLSFVERIYSTLYSIWSRLYIHFVSMPRCDKIVKKYLGEDMPHVSDSERNVSALFLSKHPVLHTTRPNVPTVIHIGSIHLKPPRPLGSELKKLLDKATEGVVLFSLGSNVKSVNISQKLRKLLMDAFSEMPYKILWKFEDDEMPNKPKNVMIEKWLPQQDVLAHPNVKVFISQCGLQSISEAVDREVPMVGLPFIAEQALNVRNLQDFGVLIGLDYLRMTKDDFKSAVLEVARNIRYKEKVRELKRIFNDEPMTALERAVWWSEYVIRHKGTRHLRSPTADIPLYQYLLLDIIGAFLGSLLLLYFFIKTVYRLFFRNTKVKTS